MRTFIASVTLLLTSMLITAAAVSPKVRVADRPTPKSQQASLSYPDGTTAASVVVAGGCFWCTEAAFEQVNGVTSVISGYAGGSQTNANYQAVSAGRTRHTESIKITFDPSKITHAEIMQIFLTIHDPTQLNRQGPDIGTQYRSTIFYSTQREKDWLQNYFQQLNRSRAFASPIATTLEPLRAFYPAETYHQDYVARHPNDPYVIQWSRPKIIKVRKLFPALTRDMNRTDAPPMSSLQNRSQPKATGSGTKPQGSGAR